MRKRMEGSSNENTRCKGSSRERVGKWQVRHKNEVIAEAKTSGKTVHFASSMPLCHIKNLELEPQYQKRVQRQSRALRWHCEWWFRIVCCIHWTGVISITNDGSKSHGYRIQTARMRRPSSRRNICLHPGQNARSTIIVNSKFRMLVIWIRPPLSSPEAIRTFVGKAIRESSIKTRLGKVPNWEWFFVIREKRRFLSVYLDDVKLGGKKPNIDPMWAILMKDVDLGEPTSFFDHVDLGCRTSDRIQDLCWSYRKAALCWESWREHFLMLTNCSEMPHW